MPETRKLFVFDLDDTLIDNVHDYAEPLLDACKFIIKTLGRKAPHVSRLIALEQEIDSRRVHEINPKTGRPYLWSMERFPGSMVEVYRHICTQSGIAPRLDVESKLYNIGLCAFNQTMYIENINPHAPAVLNFLKNQGDQCVLLTKGDETVQKRKINALDISGYCLPSYIVDNKTPEIFRAIDANWRPDGFHELWTVGNSYSSDIKPAIEAGYKGIYIPVETWETIGKMDKILAEVDKEKSLVLNALDELITRYGELR